MAERPVADPAPLDELGKDAPSLGAHSPTGSLAGKALPARGGVGPCTIHSLCNSMQWPCWSPHPMSLPIVVKIQWLLDSDRSRLKSCSSLVYSRKFCGTSSESPELFLPWRNINTVSTLESCSEDGMKKMSVLCMDFPGGSLVKNPPSDAGDARVTDSIRGSGRSPGEGNGNSLSYSCLENSIDRGAWQTTVHGIVKSQTWLSDWAQTAQCNMYTNVGHTEGAQWMLLFWLSYCYLYVQSAWSSSFLAGEIYNSHWEGLMLGKGCCHHLELVLWDNFPSLKSSCCNYPKDSFSLRRPASTSSLLLLNVWLLPLNCSPTLLSPPFSPLSSPVLPSLCLPVPSLLSLLSSLQAAQMQCWVRGEKQLPWLPGLRVTIALLEGNNHSASKGNLWPPQTHAQPLLWGEFGIAGRDGEEVRSVSTAPPYLSIPRIHFLLPEKSGQGSQRGQWKGPGRWEHMKTNQA